MSSMASDVAASKWVLTSVHGASLSPWSVELAGFPCLRIRINRFLKQETCADVLSEERRAITE